MLQDLIHCRQVAICKGHCPAHSLDGLCNKARHSSRGARGDDISDILRILGAIVAKCASVWVGVQHMADAKALRTYDNAFIYMTW